MRTVHAFTKEEERYQSDLYIFIHRKEEERYQSESVYGSHPIEKEITKLKASILFI